MQQKSKITDWEKPFHTVWSSVPDSGNSCTIRKKGKVTAVHHTLDRRKKGACAGANANTARGWKTGYDNRWTTGEEKTLPDESKLCDMLRGRMTDRYAHVWRREKKKECETRVRKMERKALKWTVRSESCPSLELYKTRYQYKSMTLHDYERTPRSNYYSIR